MSIVPRDGLLCTVLEKEPPAGNSILFVVCKVPPNPSANANPNAKPADSSLMLGSARRGRARDAGSRTNAWRRSEARALLAFASKPCIAPHGTTCVRRVHRQPPLLALLPLHTRMLLSFVLALLLRLPFPKSLSHASTPPLPRAPRTLTLTRSSPRAGRRSSGGTGRPSRGRRRGAGRPGRPRRRARRTWRSGTPPRGRCPRPS